MISSWSSNVSKARLCPNTVKINLTDGFEVVDTKAVCGMVGSNYFDAFTERRFKDGATPLVNTKLVGERSERMCSQGNNHVGFDAFNIFFKLDDTLKVMCLVGFLVEPLEFICRRSDVTQISNETLVSADLGVFKLSVKKF